MSWRYPLGKASMTSNIFLSECEDETRQFAEWLGSVVSGGHVIGLSGDLGAGKTTIVRHLVHTLGGSVQEVASPSYALEYQYQLPAGRTVEHWDLYRISELPGELYEPPSLNVIRIIEWPEKVAWPANAFDFSVVIEMEQLAEVIRRTITVKPASNAREMKQ